MSGNSKGGQSRMSIVLKGALAVGLPLLVIQPSVNLAAYGSETMKSVIKVSAWLMFAGFAYPAVHAWMVRHAMLNRILMVNLAGMLLFLVAGFVDGWLPAALPGLACWGVALNWAAKADTGP